MALNGFRVLLFVPPAPEVLSTLRLTPLFFDQSFHRVPLKIRFTLTWLPHYIILIYGKETNLQAISHRRNQVGGDRGPAP